MSNAISPLKSLPGNLKEPYLNIPPPEMFLRNSIEHILNDKDIKRKENAQLKKACETALGEFITLNFYIQNFMFLLHKSLI